MVIKNEYVITENKFKFTEKQAQLFITKVKKLKKKDVLTCPNIMMLFAEAIFLEKPIDYTKCFS